jgi:diaminopimelate decarboxylase
MANPAPAPTRLADAIVAGCFAERDGQLVIGGVTSGELARAYGTPLYVYDGALMRVAYQRLSRAVAGFAEVYYSIKANPNPHIARIFVAAGAGLEIASGAEFQTARAAGCAPDRIVFAGPGKSPAELALTIEGGVGEIHLESFEEIEHVARIAVRLGREVRVALRVNPTASARGGAMQMGGRPAPFGFDEEILDEVLAAVDRHPKLRLGGIHVFSGTQILDHEILAAQWEHAITLAGRVAAKLSRPIETIDLGGGLGIPYYAGDRALDLARVAEIVPPLRARLDTDPLLRSAHVILEPGRFLTGPAGVYLMAVRCVKTSRAMRFAVCDGGMHHHLAASGNLGQVVKRDYPIVAANRMRAEPRGPCCVVGPLCTPLDTLGRNVELPELKEGDLIAVLQSGAYGPTASPAGFLSHPVPAEVLVENGRHQAIRERAALWQPTAASAGA